MRIESRIGTVTSVNGPGLSLKEDGSSDGVVTIGASRDREKSKSLWISRHARPLSPVFIYSSAFFASLSVSLIVFRVALLQLAQFSGNSDYSYIPLIPLISAFLILVRKESICERVEPSLRLGGCVLAGGMLLWFTKDLLWVDPLTRLEFSALAIVSAWCGLFVLCYGHRASRTALLPLSLLLFMIPPPESTLNVVIQFLRQWSAVVSSEMFHLVGVPALREGTVIFLPKLTIVVAPECSGIRSSISMLIVTWAVADLYLRCGWNKVLLLLSIVPLVVVKNAIRIVTLSTLAIYIDPGFLTGPLHHRGGILFFLIGMAVVIGIVMVMQWFERNAAAASSSKDANQAGE